MTEREKMLSGQLYDPNDEELAGLRAKAHRLCRDYNLTLETEEEKRRAILQRIMFGTGLTT